MRRAALGFLAHSGWAVMVAVAEPMDTPVMPTASMVIERRRISLVGAGTVARGAAPVQPYHAARELDLERAQQIIERCVEEATRLAESAVRAAIEGLRVKDWEAAACGILLASGRPLPSLAKILSSHSLIHAAEGELFRNALKSAGESCGLGVIGARERDLYPRAAAALGAGPEQLRSDLDRLGRALGPPWRRDEKYAALVGWLALSAASRAPVLHTQGGN
jgi:hypothetical protein